MNPRPLPKPWGRCSCSAPIYSITPPVSGALTNLFGQPPELVFAPMPCVLDARPAFLPFAKHSRVALIDRIPAYIASATLDAPNASRGNLRHRCKFLKMANCPTTIVHISIGARTSRSAPFLLKVDSGSRKRKCD